MCGLRRFVVLDCLLVVSLAACAPPEVPEYRRTHGLVLLDLPPAPEPAATDDYRARLDEKKDELDARVEEQNVDLGGDQGVEAKAALDDGVRTTTVSSTGERGPNTRVEQTVRGLVPLAPPPLQAPPPPPPPPREGPPTTPVVVVASTEPPPRDDTDQPTLAHSTDAPSLRTQGVAHGPRSSPMPEAVTSENERVLELGIQGQASPEVLQVLRGQRNALQRCYDALMLRAPATTEGNVTVRFTLSPAGEVQAADVIGGTLDDVDFRQCVVGRLQSLTFPRADSGAVFTYPFRFGGGPALGDQGE
jgi:outer membrane biosynthesis protein TonB